MYQPGDRKNLLAKAKLVLPRMVFEQGATESGFLALGCVLLARAIALLFMKQAEISGEVGGH